MRATIHYSDGPRRAGLRRLATGMVLLVALLSAAASGEDGSAGGRSAPEYQIKAAYLYKFLLFITWPSVPDDLPSDEPIVIGILGTDRFGGAFSEVEGTRLQPTGRPLRIRRLGPYGNGVDLRGCHMLFIDISERARLADILAAAHKAGVVTVSDMKTFADQGGMIGMVVQKGLVRWEINRRSLHEVGVSLSSQLLRNAVRVLNDSGPPGEKGSFLRTGPRSVDAELARIASCSLTGI